MTRESNTDGVKGIQCGATPPGRSFRPEREPDTQDVYPTEPATRLYPWQSAPSLLEQALEAARDDPSLTQLTGMVLDCPQVEHIMVDGDDERWRPTEIAVCFADDHGTGTDEIITLMARAGWRPTHVCFSRERITFEEVSDGDE